MLLENHYESPIIPYTNPMHFDTHPGEIAHELDLIISNLE